MRETDGMSLRSDSRSDRQTLARERWSMRRYSGQSGGW